MQKNREIVRCINKKINKVAGFERWICEDPSWQSATGYVPQELPKEEEDSKQPEKPKLGRPKTITHAD